MKQLHRRTPVASATWALLLLTLFACRFKDGGEESPGPGNGGSPGGAATELCANGVDDDADGDIDCADLTCSAVSPDPTAPTGFADSVAWLYRADPAAACAPLQRGVSSAALDPLRVGVVRGSVSDDSGQPLAGVRVSVVGEPAFGWVESRADGMFDIAVNGGAAITLELREEGFLVAHRRADVPLNDYAWVRPIALKPVSGAVTALSFGAASAAQVLRAEASEDASGVRQPALLFPAQTQAFVQNTDGSETPIGALSVRLTEFTVGEAGPAAMPADLPPASAYTYAFELSADEAEAAGARGVRLDKPLPIYVENFLGFPAGTSVPVGYYNRESAAWEAVDDGVVLAILAEAEGRAALDSDGDGVAETAAELEAAGIGVDEQQKLAELYEPGQSLWRATIEHFSAYDLNWPFGFPSGAIGPPAGELAGGATDTPGCASGSIIRVDNRTLGESFSVAGTGYSLYYQSDRVPGGQSRTVDARVGDSVLPPSLLRIDATLEIAGQQHVQSFGATPDQRFVHEWDGQNAYGFPIQGSQPFTLRVGYVYAGVYAESERNTKSFGSPGEIRLEGNRTREEVVSVREIKGSLGGWDARGQSLGGLTLDVHHVYDPKARILYLGDGSQRSSETVPLSLVDVLAEFEATPDQVFVHPDGRVFITEDTNGEVLVLSGGQLVPFAGGGMPADGVGDGGPATEAALGAPQGLALAPDGSLFVADETRIRRIDPNGIISTFAGGGGGGLLDGELATAGDLETPDSLAFGPDGALYFAELYSYRVRRVDSDGIVTTFAGTGSSSGAAIDGGLATATALNEPSGLAFAPDGSLYISARFDHRIWRVTPDGTIRIAAGTGEQGSTGDGGPAAQATLDTPRAIAFDARGNLMISEQGSDRVRQVGPDGIITTLVDSVSSDGALVGPDGIDVGPDGSVYVVSEAALLRVAQALPNTSLSDLSVASQDGAELYRFDRLGKHQSTLDTLTGSEIRRFEYDASGRLGAITEEGLRTTRIERGEAGQPTAIVGPYGVRTRVEVNAEGFVSRLRDALDQSVTLEYAPGGLLTRLLDERNGEHAYAYENGRLVSDRDPSGVEQRLAQSQADGTLVITRTTPLGKVVRHSQRRVEGGGSEQRIEDPSGAVSVSVRDSQGNLTATLPDGTLIATRFGADPRFGAMAPLNRQTLVTLPSGLEASVSQTRVVSLANADNPLSLVRLSSETRLNARAFLSEYDAASRTLIQTSPAGRALTRLLDAQGRLVQTRVPGLDPIFYEYDADGRLAANVSGEGATAIRTSFQYSADGWLAAVTDPLGQVTTYTPDAIGQTASVAFADATRVAFAYDPAGNLTALTPPGQPVHAMSYDAIGLLGAYTPPELTSGAPVTAYAYDADRQLTRLALPGLAPIDLAYNDSGLLQSIALPEGTLSFAYQPSTLLLASSTTPGGITTEYEYDGSLETLARTTGPVTGTVTRTYDENLFVTALAVNGGPTNFTYDADGLIATAGLLALTHSPDNALLTATTLETIASAHTYTPRGELDTIQFDAGATALYAADYAYDALGRVTAVTETIAGTPTLTEYTYDAVGQLVDVRTDGAVSAAYTYDSNRNRVSTTAGPETLEATFDAQDRLLTQGAAAYAYSARGTLESRTDATGTTTFAYDSLGNLTSVTTPNATIAYLSDAENRRITRSVGGTLERAWLYQDALNPIAELDPDGTVVTRFIYGSRANVPDYILKDQVRYRIITDLRGSVRLVANSATGEIIQRLDYGPFGEVLADTNPGFQPFGFAGGLYDADTGLVRFGARDYDPSVGRWTAKDPIRFAGGQANLYAYVGNDPVNLIDPSGLWANLLGGALVGGGIDLASQLIANGGRLDCVDWAQTGVAAVSGAVLSGVGARVMAALRGGGAAAASGASNAAQGALLRAQLAAEEVAGARLPHALTGYTRHGLNQAISRDGVGVSARAIRDAFTNPLRISGESGGRFLLTGRDAAVVVNAEGRVITTWATNSAGFRVVP